MTARLLIVDDTPGSGRLLESRLSANYFDTRFVSDSRDVEAIAQEWEPDAILLDIVMPNIDGFQLCKQLKSHPETNHIPIIVTTALNDMAARRRGLEAGADEFLVKPVETEILLARLRGVVRLKQVSDEWRRRTVVGASFGLIRGSADPAPVMRGSALIVEDLQSRTLWMQKILSSSEITCVAASDTENAFSLATERKFDLIILNLSLISGDPLRLLAKLRASSFARETPILIVAESDQREMLIRGLDLGANDCITAPIDEAELLLRVRNQIRRKQYQERLRNDLEQVIGLAAIDPLTKLFNRRYLVNYLERRRHDPSEHCFAILMIDVDHFKQVNDQFGHLAGDRVLTSIAETIRANLRVSDIAARYGGEEFIVFLQDVATDEDALNVANKLRKAVEEIAFLPACAITISLGIALCRTDDSVEMMLNAADRALYSAKLKGRNQAVCYSPDQAEPNWRRESQT